MVVFHRKESSKSKKGQALVELLPSLVIFFMVISASLSYFEIMRGATIRQEVVRNLAFAKMNNMGTLTTPTGKLGAPIQIEGVAAISGNDNDFVGFQSNCFSVSPANLTESFQPKKIIGVSAVPPVEVSSYAVVYRRPGSQCQ